MDLSEFVSSYGLPSSVVYLRMLKGQEEALGIASLVDSNWVSLRTNGSVKLDEGFAAAGGFVCNHNDGWIMGFCGYLGNCTVVEAEL
ncbi:hypothetical protein Goarm_002129 [Gossypium armourianum]|uniref:RNase H type-1 domain-containing protein n=1 Tax=Gossypium armourianum TaxID=34283 RepID=A0A7J9K7B1_9ROSI|nr:hypothetical protein [Gossypium armourianum]